MDRIGRLLGNVFASPIPNGNGKHAAPDVKASALISLTTTPVSATTPTQQYPFWVIDDDGKIVREIMEASGRRGMGAYMASVLVYAAVSYRMQKLVEAPLMVVKDSDAGEKWITDHELAPLLDQPNPDQETADLIEETHLHLDLTGRSLWVKSRDRSGRVGELRAFSGDEFRVERDDRRLFARFFIDSVRREPFLAEDVVFHRYPHPSERDGGFAPVKAVADMLGIGDALAGHVKRALENGAMPGGSFKVPENRQLTDEEFQRLDAQVRARYSGGNSFRPFLAEGGLEYQATAHTLNDMQMGELWRECEAAVCTAFRVRPEILGMLVGLENSPWSHMQTAQRLSYDEAIIPLWTRIERTLTRQLLRPVDDNPSHLIRFDRSRIGALQDDVKEKAQIAKDAADILTVDERRVFLGFKPLGGPEGERITAGAPTGAPDTRPAVDGEAKSALHRLQTKQQAMTEEDLEWIIYESLLNGHEASLWLSARLQLEEDRDAALEIIRDSAGVSITPVVLASLLSRFSGTYSINGASGRRWMSTFRPLLGGLTRSGFDRLPQQIRAAINVGPDAVAAFAQREAAFLVTSVTHTTRDALRAAVTQAMKDGATVDQLASRIQDLGEFSDSRAQLIAQTETTRVLNGALDEGAARYEQETGRKVQRIWNTQRDARVREAHAAQDREAQPVGKAFSNGRLYPDEPNCRCYLTITEAAEVAE